MKERYNYKPLTLHEFMFIIERYDKDFDDCINEDEWIFMLIPFNKKVIFMDKKIMEKIVESNSKNNDVVEKFSREFQYIQNVNQQHYGTHTSFKNLRNEDNSKSNNGISNYGGPHQGINPMKMQNEFLKIKDKNLAIGSKSIRDQLLG